MMKDRVLITTGNIIAALIILISAYLMTTGFYRATMVLHGDQAIHLLYGSTAWAVLMSRKGMGTLLKY